MPSRVDSVVRSMPRRFASSRNRDDPAGLGVDDAGLALVEVVLEGQDEPVVECHGHPGAPLRSRPWLVPVAELCLRDGAAPPGLAAAGQPGVRRGEPAGLPGLVRSVYDVQARGQLQRRAAKRTERGGPDFVEVHVRTPSRTRSRPRGPARWSGDVLARRHASGPWRGGTLRGCSGRRPRAPPRRSSEHSRRHDVGCDLGTAEAGQEDPRGSSPDKRSSTGPSPPHATLDRRLELLLVSRRGHVELHQRAGLPRQPDDFDRRPASSSVHEKRRAPCRAWLVDQIRARRAADRCPPRRSTTSRSPGPARRGRPRTALPARRVRSPPSSPSIGGRGARLDGDVQALPHTWASSARARSRRWSRCGHWRANAPSS